MLKIKLFVLTNYPMMNSQKLVLAATLIGSAIGICGQNTKGNLLLIHLSPGAW